MKCKKCGKELSPNDKFCRECGAKNPNREANQKAQEQKSNCIFTKKENYKKLNIRIVIPAIIVLALILSLIICVAITCYSYEQIKKNTKPTDPPKSTYSLNNLSFKIDSDFDESLTETDTGYKIEFGYDDYLYVDATIYSEYITDGDIEYQVSQLADDYFLGRQEDVTSLSVDYTAYVFDFEKAQIYVFANENEIYTFLFDISYEFDWWKSRNKKIIDSVELKQSGFEEPTTEKVTEPPTEKPSPNTSEAVDYIAKKAKADSATASNDDIHGAVFWLKENVDNIFDNNENMEKAMYYGELLEYRYKGTNDPYEKIGWQAFKTIKYVYRDFESVTDNVTQDNLQKLRGLLKSI